MRHAIRAVIAATALAIGVGATAHAQSPTPADDEVVMRIGTTSDMTTANPFGVSSGSDWITVTAQYDLMLKFSDEDLSPAPSVATGCEPSEDSMTWTCQIRDDITWSDGEPLTSEDVAFSFRFVIDNKVPQYRSYFPFNPTFETPDATTLIWTAEKPTFAPDMPPWVYVVPEHVWSQYDGESLKDIRAVRNVPSVASGPFILTSWDRGQGWTMERNPAFWGDEPVVDRLDFRLYSNQEAMTQALRQGEIDFADGLQPALVNSLEGLENVTTQKVVSDWWLNLAFNFGGQGAGADPLPALKDLQLRQAIRMAIDTQVIVDKVYVGQANPGETVVREASAYWHLDIPDDQLVAYDPDAANALLDEAGYADTDDDGVREDPATGQPLVLRMPASTDTTGAVDAGKLVVGFLDQVGIDVELKAVTDAKMNDYWGTGNFDAYIWYWSGDPDPNFQLSIFTTGQCGGWSDGCFADPAYDALYEEQRGIMDRDARREVVFEAQQYLYDNVPGIALAYPSWLQAYRNDRFTGWIPAPGESGYLIPGYNYDGLVAVRPVTEEEAAQAGTTSSTGGGVPSWVWIAIVAVAVAAVVAIGVRSRRAADDDVE